MFDYSAIAALAAVIDSQSFELAANKLHITQSAVSQRIKSLENYYGEPLLIRSQPYQPTKLGQYLLGHYAQVVLLEQDLRSKLTADIHAQRISVAISRDSLETWFIHVMNKLKTLLPITLEIIADDQEITHEYLRKGLVSVCASTSAKEISGCKIKFLGYYDYVLVASPSFKKKYFNDKKNICTKLIDAPSVIFDHQDNLQARYLKKFFGITDTKLNDHVVPSVAGFRQFALEGYAYALIPKIDIIHDLNENKLINLFPDKVWEMPLYWHSWSIETHVYKQFNDLVYKVAQKYLRQK